MKKSDTYARIKLETIKGEIIYLNIHYESISDILKPAQQHYNDFFAQTTNNYWNMVGTILIWKKC